MGRPVQKAGSGGSSCDLKGSCRDPANAGGKTLELVVPGAQHPNFDERSFERSRRRIRERSQPPNTDSKPSKETG